MNHSSGQPRGFCPGVWTPMEAGDGWIVRVRPSHARIPARRLDRLARLARWGGNGIIELTRRANLQIRGVSSAHLEPLRAELLALE